MHDRRGPARSRTVPAHGDLDGAVALHELDAPGARGAGVARRAAEPDGAARITSSLGGSGQAVTTSACSGRRSPSTSIRCSPRRDTPAARRSCRRASPPWRAAAPGRRAATCVTTRRGRRGASAAPCPRGLWTAHQPCAPLAPARADRAAHIHRPPPASPARHERRGRRRPRPSCARLLVPLRHPAAGRGVWETPGP